MATLQIRKPRIENELVYVPLPHGYEAVIDLIDLPLVEGFNWSVVIRSKTAYAYRKTTKAGNQKTVYLHRLIAETPDHLFTDHIDGNGLNNTRQNLRHATKAENMCNRGRNLNNTSGFKGVSFDKFNDKWKAGITVGGKHKNLGRFDCPEEAHQAYCAAAINLHGEFSKVR